MPGEQETQQSAQTTQTTGTETATQTADGTQTTQRRSLLNEPTAEVSADPAQQTPEQKAAADKAEADKGKKPSGAPEKYEPFKAPEGYELDEKVVAGASELFKELGLSQEQAQKLVDFYGKDSLSAKEAAYKGWTDTQEEWIAKLKTDPEIGGSKLDKVRASIGRAIDRLGPVLGPQFREAMDFTGAGNNPAFAKAMNLWSEMLGEGTSVRGNGPTDGSPPGARPSAAQAIYPTLPSAAKG